MVGAFITASLAVLLVVSAFIAFGQRDPTD